MKNTFFIASTVTAIAALFGSALTQAATVNSSVITISMPVTSPTCTVSNNNSAIPLPSASVGQTVGAYQSLNLTTPPATAPSATSVFTSTSLNQTATITCNAANTSISSFVVQPGPSAVTSPAPGLAAQYLVDATTPTPVKAGGGTMFSFVVEQVSVNGAPAPFLYAATNTNAINPYITPFSTGVLNPGSPPTSTATVVWRPVFWTGVNDQNKFPAPTGGSFNGSFQIVVIY